MPELTDFAESEPRHLGPEPHEIEQQKNRDLLRRVNERRSKAKKSLGGEIHRQDPSKVYIWANVHPMMVARSKELGYEIVRSREANKSEGNSDVTSAHLRQDGTHVNGDLIAMQIDKDEYHALKAAAQLESLEAIGRSKEGMLAYGERIGMPVELTE